MKQTLDITTWHRRDHFFFFKQFEEPFFGVTVLVDCTKGHAWCKANGTSFFLFYLHRALVAANALAPFRYRIQNDSVTVWDVVHASPTINRPNGSFGFSYINFYPQFDTFVAQAQLDIARVKESTGLVPATAGENVIHFSAMPWLHFTSVSHARAFSFADSIPKITFGKMVAENNVLKMPVSIHVHHALMDGYDVAQFVDRFQEAMNTL